MPEKPLTEEPLVAANPPETSASASPSQQVSELLRGADLGEAIETEEFKQLLDHIPIPILIAKDADGISRIVYANGAFEALVGQTLDELRGHVGSILDALKGEDDEQLTLRQALQDEKDEKQFLGTFVLDVPKVLIVEAYANLIETDDGAESYRIFALIDVTARTREQREEFSRRLRDKDVLLSELQHRVRNNLQLITAK